MADARKNVCSVCGTEPAPGTLACPNDGSTLFVEAPVPDPLIGMRLGDYQVLEPIGEGGMGLVYRGIQPTIKKRVAIKVLRAEIASDPAGVKGLRREAEAANAISHRNIIDVFGFGQLPDGRHYIVMEYLDGEPLDKYLKLKGQLSPLEAVELLTEICDPLCGAHAAGVIHRDLKPSNVFLVQPPNGSRYLKLLDFGLAHQTTNDRHTTQTSEYDVSGTPDYMAPEQCRGADLSFRVDLYALGVMGWQMLTGKVPFTGETPMDVMIRHVQEKPPPPSTFQPGVPPAVDALIGQLLEKDPDLRPRTAEAVLTELKRIGRGLRMGEPLGGRKRGRAGWLAAGGGLLVATGAIVWLRLPAAPVIEPAPIALRIEAAPAAPVVAIPVEVPVALEVDAGTGDEPVQHGPPRKNSKAPVRDSAPSVATLTRRIRLLEVRLRKSTAQGAEPDPSAIQLLNKQRLRLSLVLSGAERKELSKKLDSWEKAFLSR